ncbi:ATP-binding cassette domain-containing protein [Lachnospiraceae bacterium LCP25S3_G4]
MENKSNKVCLRAQNIYKSFRHVEALQGVDIEVCQGEILAIVGDNGAGKSTLIKVLNGVLQPDKGTIEIMGEKVEHLTPKKALTYRVSTVYQDLALANTRSTVANVFLGHEITKCGLLQIKIMKSITEELIKGLDIHLPDIDEPVGMLSGGQRQGVAVARAIHQGGKILIFDEPTAAMGLNEATAVLKLIKKLSKDGYAVIIISHNLQQVFQVATKICVMRQGCVINTVYSEASTMDEVVSMITGVVDLSK